MSIVVFCQLSNDGETPVRSSAIYRTSETGNELPYYEPPVSLDVTD
ncbi:MAG: hypothetical protein OXN25_03985 [Candidatus Poribacteria bacterium]|nr:hypothetical protein [Candidatus Poribacteria bacterium]